jgi:rare lipoprotein A
MTRSAKPKTREEMPTAKRNRSNTPRRFLTPGICLALLASTVRADTPVETNSVPTPAPQPAAGVRPRAHASAVPTASVVLREQSARTGAVVGLETVGAETVGAASYYADKYHGRPTASGEIFNQRDLTAAHRSLPFGTRVKVTRLTNQRSVVVRINDRGPFAPGRILDLSRAAAEALGMVEAGLAEVRVEVLTPSQ